MRSTIVRAAAGAHLLVAALVGAGVTAAPSLASAQQLPAGVTRGASVEGITEYTLATLEKWPESDL